jgi:hypothetical protein
MKFVAQFQENKEKRYNGGHGRAATRAPSPRPHPPLPLLYDGSARVARVY